MCIKYVAHHCQIHRPPLSYLREGVGGSRGGRESLPKDKGITGGSRDKIVAEVSFMFEAAPRVSVACL